MRISNSSWWRLMALLGGMLLISVVVLPVAAQRTKTRTTTPARKPTTTAVTFRPSDPKIEMVLIQPGTFMMGRKPEPNVYEDLPYGMRIFDEQHQVTISKGFYLGKYEVTQAQWQAVMGNNPSHFKDCGECPVEQVTYSDVKKFIAKLNALSKVGGFRLPTEAEWEYACRAGTTGLYAGDLDAMAWFGNNSGNSIIDSAQLWNDAVEHREIENYEKHLNDNGNKTHPVGKKQPNAWGLYDMHGNVSEWVQDWYDSYEAKAQTDPPGPISGDRRSWRGGSWFWPGRAARSEARYFITPNASMITLGFRLARMFK